MPQTKDVTLAPGVHRLGTDKVNSFLIEEDGQVTMVDAGVPRYRGQLEPALSRIGRSFGDLAAVVLTHAHSDHTGFASELHERGVPVYVHEQDRQLLATHKEPKREAGMLPYLRHGTAWGTIGHLVANGGLKAGKISDPVVMDSGTPLDVPGRPVPIHTPGHTDGHCALHFESKRVLLVGDLICTWHPLNGRRGPALMPGAFNKSSAQSLSSLAAIENVDVDLVLPGHGEPWAEGAAAGVARVRETGPS